MRSLKTVERMLLLAGLALLSVYAMSEIHSFVVSRAALASFRAIQKTTSAGDKQGSQQSGSSVDFRLWSAQRIEAYLESLTKNFDPPLAVLRIERLRIETPVFNGTDEPTLNRGAGRIIGTGVLGEGGNIGISAHRDGFFRSLKDVRLGDSIVLELGGGKTETYVVDEIQIVTPENVEVLRPRAAPSVTLVTCYPFYFIGSAPKRFIVQGSLRNNDTKD
jgi:sortase A